MFRKRKLAYLAILIGSFIIIYTQDNVQENWYYLIIGIVLLMGGIYVVSTGIQSGSKPPETYIRSEEEEE